VSTNLIWKIVYPSENIEVVMEKILGNEWIKLNHRSRSNQCCFMYL